MKDFDLRVSASHEFLNLLSNVYKVCSLRVTLP